MMTKKEFTKELSKRSGWPYTKSLLCVNYMIEIAQDAIIKGNGLKLPGLGSWSVYVKGGFARANKDTGKPEYVPPTCYVRFRASKFIKEKLQRISLPVSKGKIVIGGK